MRVRVRLDARGERRKIKVLFTLKLVVEHLTDRSHDVDLVLIEKRLQIDRTEVGAALLKAVGRVVAGLAYSTVMQEVLVEILEPFVAKHGLSVNEFSKRYNNGTLREPLRDFSVPETKPPSTSNFLSDSDLSHMLVNLMPSTEVTPDETDSHKLPPLLLAGTSSPQRPERGGALVEALLLLNGVIIKIQALALVPAIPVDHFPVEVGTSACHEGNRQSNWNTNLSHLRICSAK